MTTPLHETAATDADAAAAAAARAFMTSGDESPASRARSILAIADAVEAARPRLLDVAREETGLAPARLDGELTRTIVQLRLFATVITHGAYLDARLDEADTDFALGQRADLRRVLVPRGPVLNFAASNFPFAFSVLGGDTAAALAAGCSVIVKAHPGHPRLSALTHAFATDALRGAGADPDLLQIVYGQDAGIALLRDPRVKVASFTGSQRVGRLLADIAAARPDPIPFYGELGSVNPVVITSAALDERAERIAAELVASVSGSAGQLCTKPGIVFTPSVESLHAEVARLAAQVPEHRLLNTSISDAYARRREEVLGAHGVRVVHEGRVRIDDAGLVWATPTIVAVGVDDFRAAGAALQEEAFGPLAVIVESGRDADFAGLLAEFFDGNLTTTLHLGEGEIGHGIPSLVRRAALTSGRVIFNQWPTGVAVTSAMQHGGPWPATTIDSTSVGTAAIERFLRGVAYQNAPDALLPYALCDENPWRVPQRTDPAGSSRLWGLLAPVPAS